MCMHVVVAHAQSLEPNEPPSDVATVDAGAAEDLPTAPRGPVEPTASDDTDEAVESSDAGVRIDVRVHGPRDVEIHVLPKDPEGATPTSSSAASAAVTPAQASVVSAPASRMEPSPLASERPAWLEGLTLTPELQVRAREELFAHPYAGTVGSYSLATRYRARGGVTLERDVLIVRLQAQAVGVFGEGLGPAGAESSLGLHQGYAQLGGRDAWLRLGRQEISLGDQRLIGALDWNMTARSMDALRLHAETGRWVVDGFAAVVRAQADYVDRVCREANAGDPTGCDMTHGSGDYVGGVYGTWKRSDAFAADVYLLIRHDGANAEDWRRERDVFSPGARAFGELGGYLRYKAEAIYQAGRMLSATTPRRPHRAAAVLGELGFEVDEDATTIMAVGGAYATGQSASSSWTELENFFPSNHRIYGVADLIGLRNLQQAYASLNWSAPAHHLQGFVALHFLSLATAEGRWTNALGNPLSQAPTPGNSRFLGTNWDAVIRYSPSSQLFIEGGYSLFIPDAAAERFGKTEAQHFLYVWTEAKLP